MQNPTDLTRPASAALVPPTMPQRLFGRWWRKQSPARQDRFATIGPLISVLLFLAAIIFGVLVLAQRGIGARD